jgi:hypothetical protein
MRTTRNRNIREFPTENVAINRKSKITQTQKSNRAALLNSNRNMHNLFAVISAIKPKMAGINGRNIIDKEGIFKILPIFASASSIIQKNNTGIYTINPTRIGEQPVGDDYVETDYDVADLESYFNTGIDKDGTFNTIGVAANITSDPRQKQKVFINKSQFQLNDSSKNIDEFEFNLESPIILNPLLNGDYNQLPNSEKPIYIVYSDIFDQGGKKNRHTVHHISILIIYNNRLFSFGWGTNDEGGGPSHLRPYQRRVGRIQTPEVISTLTSKKVIKSFVIIDIGYFSNEMKTRLTNLFDNGTVLNVAGRFQTAIDTTPYVQIFINDYRLILDDVNYRMASNPKNNTEYSCVSFTEYIIGTDKINCQYLNKYCSSSFLFSKPNYCTRLQDKDNYITEEGDTDFIKLIDDIHSNKDNIDNVGVKGGRKTKKNKNCRKTTKRRHSTTKRKQKDKRQKKTKRQKNKKKPNSNKK